MNPFLFYIFSAIMLTFGVCVVINRNPVASAISLVISFLCLAALYVGLDAYFIGAIQVVVYAGAVMVLFLFIIMLLDLQAEQRRKLNKVALVGGFTVALAFVAQLCAVLQKFPMGKKSFPPLTGVPAGEQLNDLKAVGQMLFTHYTLPFQVIGVLILVATVGVIVISKRELK